MPGTAIIIGEFAKIGLQAWLLWCEQQGLTKEETLTQVAMEYEGFRQRDPDKIPDPPQG